MPRNKVLAMCGCLVFVLWTDMCEYTTYISTILLCMETLGNSINTITVQPISNYSKTFSIIELDKHMHMYVRVYTFVHVHGIWNNYLKFVKKLA